MKHMIYLPIFMLLLWTTDTYGQTPEVRSSEAEMNGVVVTFSTASKWGVSTSSNPTRADRVLINDSTGIYVGYSFTVEQVGNSTKLKVTISPLSESTIQRLHERDWMKRFRMKWPNRTSFDPSPLPRFPEPMVIDVTEVIKLPLWINPETGAQMGDEIRFALPRLSPVRDFKLDEVKLKLSNHRLIINGEVRGGDQPMRDIAGPFPFFSVPGKGRFILSLFSHEGYDFKKIGMIDNNKISFSYGGDSYEWVSQQPVLNRYDKWHLWVMHDDRFQASPEDLDTLNKNNKGNCCGYGVLDNVSMLPSKK